MIKNNLLKYLLISPNLPVGGFCYSEGMESFINWKNIEDPKEIKEMILNELNFGQIRIEARSLVDFRNIFKNINKKNNLKNKSDLISLDKLLMASRDSEELRDQQNQMAKSLIELTREFGFKFYFDINENFSWPLAWSWACFCFKINNLEMVENFIYSWTANQLSAALRLIPIGSTKAQIIQYELIEIISETSKKIIDNNINNIYVGNIGVLMAQQKHNDLYSKLFRN